MHRFVLERQTHDAVILLLFFYSNLIWIPKSSWASLHLKRLWLIEPYLTPRRYGSLPAPTSITGLHLSQRFGNEFCAGHVEATRKLIWKEARRYLLSPLYTITFAIPWIDSASFCAAVSRNCVKRNNKKRATWLGRKTSFNVAVSVVHHSDQLPLSSTTTTTTSSSGEQFGAPSLFELFFWLPPFWSFFQRRQGKTVFLDVLLGIKHYRDLNKLS